MVSCQLKDIQHKTKFLENKNKIDDSLSKEKIKKSKVSIINNNKTLKYIIGNPYFISGVQYVPEENYTYNKVGFASFYDKNLHNKKTINNDYNKVTELLGRHKTLPIPSVVKVTNLENGLSLIIKIIDRHNDNSSLIQLSRKSAQLLKFYKNKIAKVRVQILSDPSKQLKVVTESMSNPEFNETMTNAPTQIVNISEIDTDLENVKKTYQEAPIELEYNEVANKNMYLKIYDFKSYEKAKQIFNELGLDYKFTTQNDQDSFTLIIGPLENKNANKLVLSFISKGYKNTEFFLE